MSEARIRGQLVKAHDEGQLVSCRIPGGGNISIALERHMVDQAMAAWKGIPPADRERTFASVSRAIKRGVKRMKQKRARPAEMDALAADIALWLGHELVFADGEKHLIKGASRTMLAGENA